MVDVGRVCLGLNTVLYLLYAYKFIFDLRNTMSGYEVVGSMPVSCREEDGRTDEAAGGSAGEEAAGG